MKMPTRANYTNGMEFVTALNEWMAASEGAYQFLKGLYAATPASDRQSDWVESAASVKNVSMNYQPDADDVDVALRTLSSAVMNDGRKIARISHGMFGASWAIFAEMQPL